MKNNVDDKRRAPREIFYSKAILTNENTPAYVRDISVLGCKLDFLFPINSKKEEITYVHFLPEDETGIPEFTIQCEIRWKAESKPYYSIGVRFIDVDITNDARLKALVRFIHSITEK